MTSEELFRILIVEPLEAVTHTALLHVSYWLIECDMPDFDVEAPSMTGPSAISMVFEGGTLEINWGWETPLRRTNAYHIQTQLVTEGTTRSDLGGAQSLTAVSAVEATIWRHSLNKTLERVVVYGFASNPQAIRFVFPSAKPVITVGYAGDQPLVGDADEMLVLSDEEWRHSRKTLGEEFIKLWGC